MQISSLKVQIVTPTPSAHGTYILKSIKENELKKDFLEEGPSVLTEEETNALLSITGEHKLIVSLTKTFENIFSGFAVVNSETIPWLNTGLGHFPQKPDLFVCQLPIILKPKFTRKNTDMGLSKINVFMTV